MTRLSYYYLVDMESEYRTTALNALLDAASEISAEAGESPKGQSSTGSTVSHDGRAINTGPIAEAIRSMSERFAAEFRSIHAVVDSLNS